jgi:hypothetical protein
MNGSLVSARVRLEQIGLTHREIRAVLVKLVEGSINTSNWNIVDNVELAEILRVLIQPGISYSIVLAHSKFCIIYIYF